ncbi:MAG: HlyD family efflux transporter periplasmic adaptor subunit [Cellulomonas sp.]|nr:HlyD family efflux transporter periplasmic adaptor subunit [Cellulomonas sp.]
MASAADVLADRAAVELAQAELDVAESRLGLADLTAPIAGTVAAVSIEEGAAVTAGSDTAVVTVVGGDGFVVTSTVTLGEVDLLEVGQPADVTVRTTDDPLTATVSSIGLLNAETTSTTPSYTVELAVDPTDARLFDGSSAQVTVAVADGDQVLTVPTSAVHVADGATTVDVLSDGAVTTVDVTTGAVGSEVTEVVDGLTAGDEVVLADLMQRLVTDGESSSGLTGLSGSDDEDAVPTGPGGFGGDFQPPGGFGGRPGE